MLKTVKSKKLLALLAISLWAGTVQPSLAQRRPAPAPTPPPFDTIRNAVEEHFAAKRDYRPGDLITQSDVQAALSAVAQVGWNVPKQKELLELTLADDDFLVQELRTKDGKKIFDRVAKFPGALDKLDRIREMPKGKYAFKTLIHKTHNSVQLIEEITTTPQGARFAQDIAKFDSSADFNKPTGRIYRVNELLAALEFIYKAELAGR